MLCVKRRSISGILIFIVTEPVSEVRMSSPAYGILCGPSSIGYVLLVVLSASEGMQVQYFEINHGLFTLYSSSPVVETYTLLTEFQSSTPLMPNPTIGHDPEPVPSTSDPHNLSP
jgi:hypothetical protein